ncbi:MAG: nucleoside-triphosphatase [Eubacteriales bacterium]|nr:nucleoside-triphosphatase [Eubacteriales bacterium]
MKKHLFLTGEKGCGKSTRIKNILRENPELRIKGFLTLRTLNDDGSYSVHILHAGTDEKPDSSNLLFYCGKDRMRLTEEESIERFNRLGSLILSDTSEADVILMDELGPHEEFATDFKMKVLELLDGDIPILGVIQKAESAFLDTIKAHPKVKVEEIIKNF